MKNEIARARAHTRAHPSSLLCHRLNAMICEIYKLFIVLSVVFIPMIDMLFFVKYFLIKPMNADFFSLSIHWHLVWWDDIYSGFLHSQSYSEMINILIYMQIKPWIQCNRYAVTFELVSLFPFPISFNFDDLFQYYGFNSANRTSPI